MGRTTKIGSSHEGGKNVLKPVQVVPRLFWAVHISSARMEYDMLKWGTLENVGLC